MVQVAVAGDITEAEEIQTILRRGDRLGAPAGRRASPAGARGRAAEGARPRGPRSRPRRTRSSAQRAGRHRRRGDSRAWPRLRPLAASYDELRPQDANWWALAEPSSARRPPRPARARHRLRHRAFAAALAERGARVWGVDPSPEMLALARDPRRGAKQAAPRRCRSRTAGSSARSCGWSSSSSTGPAFAEPARVLAPDGRLVIATFDHEHFDALLARPASSRRSPRSTGSASRRGQPRGGARERRASRRGRPVRLAPARELSRDEALERIRGRFISTLRLLDEAELAEGLARAERELAGRARRPSSGCWRTSR